VQAIIPVYVISKEELKKAKEKAMHSFHKARSKRIDKISNSKI